MCHICSCDLVRINAVLRCGAEWVEKLCYSFSESRWLKTKFKLGSVNNDLAAVLTMHCQVFSQEAVMHLDHKEMAPERILSIVPQ